METSSIDLMEEFYVDLILVKGIETHKAIFALVDNFPNATGLEYILALFSAATVLESEATKSHAFLPILHTEIYKFAGLLALDILELHQNGGNALDGHTLMAHWSLIDERLFVRT